MELVTGRLDWRIWSTDTDNPGSVGDIGVISSPYADDFAIRIENASHPNLLGARNVKGVVLDLTSASHCAN